MINLEALRIFITIHPFANYCAIVQEGHKIKQAMDFTLVPGDLTSHTLPFMCRGLKDAIAKKLGSQGHSLHYELVQIPLTYTFQ